MKTSQMFLIQCVLGVIGSIIGAYAAHMVFDKFGVLAIPVAIIMVLLLIGGILAITYWIMNRPVTEIPEVKEPEDDYKDL